MLDTVSSTLVDAFRHLLDTASQQGFGSKWDLVRTGSLVLYFGENINRCFICGILWIAEEFMEKN
jgi:hypothetical protein